LDWAYFLRKGVSGFIFLWNQTVRSGWAPPHPLRRRKTHGGYEVEFPHEEGKKKTACGVFGYSFFGKKGLILSLGFQRSADPAGEKKEGQKQEKSSTDHAN